VAPSITMNSMQISCPRTRVVGGIDGFHLPEEVAHGLATATRPEVVNKEKEKVPGENIAAAPRHCRYY
jgi:hypothetical protein